MEKAQLSVQIGVLVRRLRQEKGLSQEDFADLCGLHRTYIGSVERGEKSITVGTAEKLARALGIRLSVFFCMLEEAGE